MPRDISSIMLNPIRMRIVQTTALHNTITSGELSEILSDVPMTTLYRHIGILIDADILNIVSEKRIRGSLERTLSINQAELEKQNTLENASQKVLQSFLTIYAKFEKHFSNQNRTRETNKIFFNNTVLMMTDQEFDEFLAELQMLLVKFHSENPAGRKPRNISIISAPEDGATEDDLNE